MASPYAQTAEEVMSALGTRPSGLTYEEIENRLRESGPNVLPKTKKDSIFLLILKQLKSLVIYILLGAAAISFIFGHFIDAGVIITVIVINVIIGFFQTYRAEKAIRLLKKLIVRKAKVVRDGHLREIRARDIVPGDILFLEAGDKIPADARIIETRNFSTDESSLTGESLSVGKTVDPVQENTPVPDRKNMVWTGTNAVDGNATAVVITTGKHTEFGKIAQAVQKIKRPKTHFEKKAEELVKTMVFVAALGAALTFFIGFLLRKLDFFTIFLFSIASLVSGIPEGLPAALAIVLAVGSWRMARRKAIIRRLPAVETLGAVDIILTDKTGTLTQNKMEALQIILSDFEVSIEINNKDQLKGTFLRNGKHIVPLEYAHLAKLLHISTLTNSASIVQDGKLELFGNPTELALLILGVRAGLSKEILSTSERVVDEIPFNQGLKLHAIMVEHAKDDSGMAGKDLYVAGAFEKIMEQSETFLGHDGVKQFEYPEVKNFLSRAEKLMDEGYRLIGVGCRSMSGEKQRFSEDDIKKLTFVGIVALSDPIRNEVPVAIEKARGAGIKVIMVTGDHPITAISVARKIGLVPDDKATGDTLLTGKEVSVLSDRDLVKKLRIGITVFARVGPVTKLRITKLLQKEGHLVAVTGDGTNDAPALKQADIGVAMGERGTDVARESAEMVLVDDNFASVISAVEEGRVVFTNIRGVSFFLVSTNVGEDLTILSALGIGLGLPLLPIHVLWLNLVTDGVLVPPLAIESGHDHLLQRPSKPKEHILSLEIIPILLITGILMAVGTLFLYQVVGGGSKSPEHARAVAFSTMAFFQIFNALNLRSFKKSFFTINPLSNHWMIIGIAVSITIQVLVIHLPSFIQKVLHSYPHWVVFAEWLERVFRFAPLTIKEWVFVIITSSSILFVVEAYKLIRFKLVPQILEKHL